MITNVNMPNGHNRKTQLFTAIAAPISNEEIKPSDSSLSGAESNTNTSEGRSCGFVTMPAKVDPAKIVQDVRYANTEKYKRQREKAFRLSEQQAMYLKMFGVAFAFLTVTQAVGAPALNTVTANNQRYEPAHQAAPHQARPAASTAVSANSTAINPVQNLLNSTYVGATPLKPYSPEYAALNATHLDDNQFGMTNKVSRKHNRSTRSVGANSARNVQAKSALEEKANSARNVKSRSRRSVADSTTAPSIEANDLDDRMIFRKVRELPSPGAIATTRLAKDVSIKNGKELERIIEEVKSNELLGPIPRTKRLVNECEEKASTLREVIDKSGAARKVLKKCAKWPRNPNCRTVHRGTMHSLQDAMKSANQKLSDCEALRESYQQELKQLNLTDDDVPETLRADYARAYEGWPDSLGIESRQCYYHPERNAITESHVAQRKLRSWETKHEIAEMLAGLGDKIQEVEHKIEVGEIARDEYQYDLEQTIQRLEEQGVDEETRMTMGEPAQIELRDRLWHIDATDHLIQVQETERESLLEQVAPLQAEARAVDDRGGLHRLQLNLASPI